MLADRNGPAVQRLTKEIREVEATRVRLLREVPNIFKPDHAGAVRLQEAFRGLGLNEAAAKIAAKGRAR